MVCLTLFLFFASSIYSLKHPFISAFHSHHTLNLVFTCHCHRDNSVRLKDLRPLSLGKTIHSIHLEPYIKLYTDNISRCHHRARVHR